MKFCYIEVTGLCQRSELKQERESRTALDD